MRTAAWTTALVAAFLVAGCERPPMDTTQTGFRGTAMGRVENPRIKAAQPAQAVPAALPGAPSEGPKAAETMQNVKVLGDLSVAEFTRTMVAITNWVAPEQGCLFCHAQGEDLSSDTLYTKVVARRMIEMTRHVNGNWKTHVADTGVTCYTCHRGNAVPPEIWFRVPSPPAALGPAGPGRGVHRDLPAQRDPARRRHRSLSPRGAHRGRHHGHRPA